MTTTHDSTPEREWWRSAVFYQIYPRSFQDSNGDGIGDIPGIISRLDVLRDLGVGAIWLSPVYPSPQADNGYDIANYRDIDPTMGTLDDFDNLVAEAKQRGIRIIMDMVLNHSSDEHPWFQASRRREEPYTDYYIWQPAAPDGGPPNNWTSFFMGTVWEWDEVRGEYYLHLFDRKQPDLNYSNPAVVAEMKDVVRFWLERGVAGFRFDVINVLSKQSYADGRPTLVIRGNEHYNTTEGTHEFLRQLRAEVMEPYGAFSVGETVFITPEEAQNLTNKARGELDTVFYFDHLEVDRVIARYVPRGFSAHRLLKRLTAWQERLEWNAIALENHDQPRIVSHYGDDGVYRERSAKLIATWLLTMKGTPFIYQGQEIGMTNFDMTGLDQLNDVESHNIDALMQRFRFPGSLRWYITRQASRDNARTPVQWTSEPGAGFTDGQPWLPINANAETINFASQVEVPDSVWSYYRDLITFRAASPTLLRGTFTPLFSDKTLMAYRRSPAPDEPEADETYTIVLNFCGYSRRLSPWLHADSEAERPRIVWSNIGRAGVLPDKLEPWEAIILGMPKEA
ncbi:MAG: alpha-glucosidase [Propionibacteriaceae bacterium]|jgi:oligo-1,6-glucosidase|nr:alpha-glucosidase [Propionibacteriaceae bacterium]